MYSLVYEYRYKPHADTVYNIYVRDGTLYIIV